MNILQQRLTNQHLIGEKFESAEEVVSHLGAVQAQDYPAAKWSLALRVKNATNEIIEKDYDDGRILRTHIMRPTWHFVLPSDLRWMQELTSPNVKRLLGHYNKKLELTDELLTKTNKTIVRALLNKTYLTRQELKKILVEQLKLSTDVQRLAHIVSWAELDSLIVSGPMRGKQFTYRLVDEFIPTGKMPSRIESLARLALRYFTSHGPAQLKDFSWWSGLSLKDASEALSSIKSKLHEETSNGKVYWFAIKETKTSEKTTAFPLSIYDEYTIAYKDRTDLSETRDIERFIKMGNALTAVIVIDGKSAGTWKRIIKKDKVEIKAVLFQKLNQDQQKALEKSAADYGKFLNLTPSLVL